MQEWSPYRDTPERDSPNNVVLIQDIIDTASHDHDTAFAVGYYRAHTLSPFLQYLDCDLKTTKGLYSEGTFAPGICLSHAMSGRWNSWLGGQPVEMQAGDDVLVYGSGSDLPFTESQPDNARIKMSALYVGAEFFESAASVGDMPSELSGLLRDGKLSVLQLSNAGALRSILQRMHNNPYSGYLARLHMGSLGLAAVVELASCLGGTKQTNAVPGRRRDLAHEAKLYLDAHVADLPAMATIAANLGTNESSLRRAFKQSFGISMTEYVRDRLLEEARHLVREGRLHIAEIAYRSGFSDPANFTAAYRRHFGHPPSAEHLRR